MGKDSSEMLRFLPLGLNVQQRRCLVVGGGRVATRKVLTLLRAAADVAVVSPTLTAELAELLQAGRIRWLKESFRREHLDGVFLAVAATDDEAVNAAVVRAAAEYGALVCDASSAERSQAIFGALLDGEDFTVAVFSGGCDPARARRIRDRIADFIVAERSSEP